MKIKSLSLKMKGLESEINSNKDILAAMYTGSFGRGEADQFSDLDIELVVNKRFLLSAKNNTKSLIKKLGKIKLTYFLDDKNSKFLINDFQKIDIKLHTKESLIPWEKYSKIKIIKDKNNLLKKFNKKANKNKPEVSHEQMEAELYDTILSIITNANKSARGPMWSSMSWINSRVEKLFVKLMRIRGRLQFDFANVEKLLNKKEMKLLKNSYCFSPTKKEIKKSLKSLWKFAKYVFNEYEKKYKKRLDWINEKEFLKKIKRLLK